MKTVKYLLVSLLVITSMFLRPLCAEEIYTNGSFYYTKDSDSVTIVGYFGNNREETIPSEIAGLPVSSIASGAFYDTTLKVINLPDTIVYIGYSAFSSELKVNGLPDDYIINENDLDTSDFDLDDIDDEDIFDDDVSDNIDDDHTKSNEEVIIIDGDDINSDISNNNVVTNNSPVNSDIPDDEVEIVANDDDTFYVETHSETNISENEPVFGENGIIVLLIIAIISALAILIIIIKKRRNRK